MTQLITFNKKFSKSQLNRLKSRIKNCTEVNQIFKQIGQSGGFSGRLLGPLLKTGLPLMKNALKPLVKSVLMLLGLTTAASVADAAVQKMVLDQA